MVGGIKIPPVDTFLAGYKAGARSASRGTTVQIGYSQDFIDQAKCKTIAHEPDRRRLAGRLRVAGPCGLGALDATKERGKWGVGVDVDQSYLGPHILTSAVKRVDTGIFLAVKGAKSGKGYKRGGNLVFNLKNGGVCARQDQQDGEDPQGVARADRHAEEADHLRQDQAPDDRRRLGISV